MENLQALLRHCEAACRLSANRKDASSRPCSGRIRRVPGSQQCRNSLWALMGKFLACLFQAGCLRVGWSQTTGTLFEKTILSKRRRAQRNGNCRYDVSLARATSLRPSCARQRPSLRRVRSRQLTSAGTKHKIALTEHTVLVGKSVACRVQMPVIPRPPDCPPCHVMAHFGRTGRKRIGPKLKRSVIIVLLRAKS